MRIEDGLAIAVVWMAMGASACGSPPPPEDFSNQAAYCWREAHDFGDDGDVEAVLIYGYDADDRLVWTRADHDPYGPRDGHTNWILRYTYDDAGRVTRIDGDHVGTAQSPDEIQTWRYDDAGRPAHYTQDGALFAADGSVTFNYPADGTIDLEGTWGYDPQGRKVRRERDGLGVSDSPPDGEPDEIYAWTYDGRVVDRLEIRRHGPTAEPDEVDTFAYDGADDKVREEHDLAPVDGQPDVVLVWTYDADGRKVRRERYMATDAQPPLENPPVEVVTWTYGPSGRTLRETRDGDATGSHRVDGELDEVVEWRQSCTFDD